MKFVAAKKVLPTTCACGARLHAKEAREGCCYLCELEFDDMARAAALLESLLDGAAAPPQKGRQK